MTIHVCTDHVPGSTSCYRRHGCRCEECRAETRRRKKYSKAGASGMVPIEPVRAHMAALLERGHSLAGISRSAGLAPGHARYLYEKARKCGRDAAVRILAVRAPSGRVDATASVRRIQALLAVGWNYQEQARQLGVTRSAVSHYAARGFVDTGTAARIAALYERLWDQTPPAGQAATKARRRAQREGFPPPAAWDDGYGPHGIDNPTATPHPWRSTERKSTRWEDVLELAEAGVHITEMADRLGSTPGAIERALTRHGRDDLRARVVGEPLHRQKRWAA